MATIYRDGDSWRGIIRRKGHAPQSFSHPKKIEVEKWARRIEGSMDERQFVQHSTMPTRQLFVRFRDEVCPKRRGGRWERVRIDLLLRTAKFMDMRLCDVDGAQLKEWRDRRVAEVSGASVNREMNLMSGVFTHAIKEWHIPVSNPVRMVARPPKGRARKRRISPGELAAVWEHFGRGAPSCKRQYVPWLFEFAIETGMRLGEMCSLKWRDVHMDEHWLHVGESKNGDERDVPLSLRAVELLAQLPQGERVFPVNKGSVGTEFREGCKTLKIVDLHFHDTRHEAASRLSKKLSVIELAAVLGHRDLKSLLVYYNPTPLELAQKLHGASQSTPQHP